MNKRNSQEPVSPIIERLKSVLADVRKEAIQEPKPESIGVVEQVGDGIAIVKGLSGAMYRELLLFPKETLGLALNLERDSIGAIVLGPSHHMREGDTVSSTGRLLEIPVGESFVGRIIDPLGNPLDDKPRPKETTFYPLERIAPGVVKREPVNTPVETGVTAIDSMIPIGRGQRELVIGDRGTGKSSLPLTTIINQKDKGMICIYVAIGQKAAAVARLAATLERFDAMEHTLIVAATASVPASLQYIAPYAGCALGEYFADRGKDALIVYDDLSKHAWAYRELSLLLRRPSGREAYPGDIFYLHSRLLERACKFNQKNGGGSLTALPIIETQAGDISAYIPTNVISITDGQIYLEPDLFHAGIKPAVNIGLSVSRVGGAAQFKAMKKVAGRLRLDLAQYRELAAFAQFATELDPKTQVQLERGARVTEILKQGWDKPLALEQQVPIIWAATRGYLDGIRKDAVKDWVPKFLDYLESSHGEILRFIRDQKDLSDEVEEKLRKACEGFNRINLEWSLEAEVE